MRHGGNLRELALRAGLDRGRDSRFQRQHQSAGPAGGPARRPGREASTDWSTIPTPIAPSWSTLLAARYRRAPEQIVVGNGSTEIFFALARALPFTPGGHSRAVLCRLRRGGRRAAGREVQLSEARTRATVSPSTGRRWKAELRGDDARASWASRTIRPADVRRRDVCAAGRARIRRRSSSSTRRSPTSSPATARWPRRAAPNVIVVRSLTKFYAIPGLRLGFAVAERATWPRRIRGRFRRGR